MSVSSRPKDRACKPAQCGAEEDQCLREDRSWSRLPISPIAPEVILRVRARLGGAGRDVHVDDIASVTRWPVCLLDARDRGCDPKGRNEATFASTGAIPDVRGRYQ
jgi:hypothetical protein